jgi:hypothetical protein
MCVCLCDFSRICFAKVQKMIILCTEVTICQGELDELTQKGTLCATQDDRGRGESVFVCTVDI